MSDKRTEFEEFSNEYNLNYDFSRLGDTYSSQETHKAFILWKNSRVKSIEPVGEMSDKRPEIKRYGIVEAGRTCGEPVDYRKVLDKDLDLFESYTNSLESRIKELEEEKKAADESYLSALKEITGLKDRVKEAEGIIEYFLKEPVPSEYISGLRYEAESFLQGANDEE